MPSALPSGPRVLEADVDSRWWYWIAAVPVYALLSTLVGFLAFAAAVFGVVTQLSGVVILLVALVVLVVALPGLALAVLFPLASYLDAAAIADADLGWEPDPVLYGLVALGSVVLTGFTLGVAVALYYLYRRHEHVGVP